VKKLVHENRLLRCGYSPGDVPPSVNGHRVPKNDGVGCGRPARWSLVESSESRRHLTVCVVFTVSWAINMFVSLLLFDYVVSHFKARGMELFLSFSDCYLRGSPLIVGHILEEIPDMHVVICKHKHHHL